jgi:hypothetical protein
VIRDEQDEAKKYAFHIRAHGDRKNSLRNALKEALRGPVCDCGHGECGTTGPCITGKFS